ncbi:uncharacterized protein [Chironomus tepperi]|uniref:uncharacterized protein n=1 Tax=Chironomus tepperi TaxID=113505 RepID=UPI00391FAC9C
MKFLILLVIINTAISSSSAYIYDDRLKSLQSQLNDVKIKVDGLLKSCKNGTNSTSDDGKYKGIVATYLHNNGTDNQHQNETAKNSSYLSNLKEKIQKFFHIKKDSKDKEVTKIKRCLSKTVGRNCEKVDTKLSNDEEIKQLLMKFFKCLSLHGGSVLSANETIHTDPPDISNYKFASTTPCPEQEEDQNDNTRTQAFLRYLASSKHRVEEIGKPAFKKPDLKKTQEIIDNAKSSMWINFEVEEVSTKASTTTTEEYENVPELPILKREADTKDTEIPKKDKRNGLFKGIINAASDFQYEVPNVALSLDQSTPDGREESIDEVNKLVQKINFQQQDDLMKFLDQLNEKPKEFKFNVDKYFMLAFENLTKSGNENLEEPDNNLNVGSKKFFEFDSRNKRKRHTKDKRIQELREHFVNQFKDHQHEKIVDYKKIVEHAHGHQPDNSFLDKSYRLNDGSSKTSELIKPLHIINAIKSPKEINMDIELGEKIKEIEDDFHPAERQRTNSEGAEDAPFYKTEGVSDETAADEII